MALPPSAAAQDFDPAGRRRGATPQPSGDKPKPAAPNGPSRSPRAPRPPATSPPGSPENDGKSASGPAAATLIARYTAIALSQPLSPFPLQRLTQLYRERDGNLKALVADFEKRAETPGPEQWNAGLCLAALYVADGKPDLAMTKYEAAAALKPSDPAPLLALGQLARAQNDAAAAKRNYERALPLVGAADRETTLRALVAVSLDLKDFDAAKRYHRDLVKQSPNSLLVRAELARELEARGEYDRAETEFRDVVTASTGDNRALAPALRDLGRVLKKQHKNTEALATLKKALVAAGGEAGVRGEIFALISDVYRSDNNLGELIRLLEEERPGDFQRLVAMGALYEETGQVDKALASYRRALGTSPRNIDVRLKVIHLLQAQGELEQAIREYEALIRAAPHNPDYVFELSETLIQRGDRPRALAMLAELERRAARDEDVLVRLADFYERVEEKQKSIDVLGRLAALAPGDPSHLVELGDRFYQQGDKKRALETWARIKIVVPQRAKALMTLGEVYLDHDMPAEGVDALKEAVELEPQNVTLLKAYAVALERTATAAGASNLATQRFEEARTIWENLVAASKGDKNIAREARSHIVTLYGLLRQLEQQVHPLEKRFAARPPDLEAGKLLADVQMRLHKLPEAERTLRKIIELAPGEIESFLALERVLVLRQDLVGAIDVLKKLAEIEPKRAREFYQRMAQYAAELYRDDDAIAYAAKAVQLSPDDAEGHRKLGEMYRKKQDTGRAVLELRQAIAKNDKLFPVYFELAELLMARGEADEADRLFRRVVRSAPDEELVSQAARQSMQINLGKGTLETLEQDLLPVAIGNPRRTIYRRLLVELYGAMAFPLVQTVRLGQPAEAAQAKRTLYTMGTRAIKPLLDALADDKEAQQRIAVDLLGFVENRGAGPALFAFATGAAEQPLRVQAMLACGSLRDPALLPKYAALLLPKDDAALAPGDPIAVAAAWSVARLGDKRAAPILSRLLSKGSPELRALAAIGLGFLHEKKMVPELAALARSVEAGNVARAAAAFALGELGAKDATGTLLSLAQGAEVPPRQAALLALARLGGDAVPSTIADSLLAADPAVRESAVLSALVLETRQYRTTGEPLPVPEGQIDLRTILQRLAPGGYNDIERARALLAESVPLRRAAIASATTTVERALALADALLSRGGRPAFAPFTDGIENLDPALRQRTEQAAESIAAAVVGAFVTLERHPAADVRARAIQFLSTRKEDEAQSAVVDALTDPDESVQKLAVSAVGPVASPAVFRAVAQMLQKSPSWPLRVRAAEAFGRFGPTARSIGFAPLAEAARSDPYALVREAAMRSATTVDRQGAAAVLADVAQKDAEARLRALAKELASHDPSR
jgi:tetratricopeptide (TPR) repeat protein/HEAT repeat protein